ncbi:MAG: ABC transporter permease [Clostridiales Family XIII bacterium]|nr:ABC transporter permease [Clostridiales Family XIII bacterium]
MKKEKLQGLAMVFPSFALMVAVVFVPIIEAVVTGFRDESGGFTLQNYRLIFTDPSYYKNIVYSLSVVLPTVGLNMLIAYPLAIYTTYSKSRIARVVDAMYATTLFVPGIVATFALMNVIRDTGSVNRFFMLFGISFDPQLLYTGPGLVFMNLWFNIPFAAMILSSSLAGISTSLLESARDVGANFLEIFFKMIWPLTYKAALLSAVFVFIGCIGAFTVPFLAGANFPRMLGVALYQEFSVFFSQNMASALATVMFLLSAVAGGIYIYLQMKRDVWQNPKRG